MQLLWLSQVNDPEENLRISGFYKKPFNFKNEIVFLYDGMEEWFEKRPEQYFFAVAFEKNSGEKRVSTLRIAPKKKYLSLPFNWEVEKQGDALLIDTARYAEIRTKYFSVEDENGEMVLKPHVKQHNYYTKILAYTKEGINVIDDSVNFEKKVSNDSKVYNFGDLEVFIPPKSTRKLVCRRKTDGVILWEFRFAAYLYTEILEHEGVLYFGTSGWGGHFYGLDLKDGSLVLDINTRGTEAFSLYNGKLYLISSQGDLLVYDTKDNSSEEFSIAKNIDLYVETEFLIVENRLYALAGKRPKKDLQTSEYFVACIDIS